MSDVRNAMLAALGLVLSILALGFAIFGGASFMWYEARLFGDSYPFRYLSVPFFIVAFICGAPAVFIWFYLKAKGHY